MATAYKINVPVTNTGLWKFDQKDAAASKVSELLQEDLEVWTNCTLHGSERFANIVQKHHVFFNQEGFHNHVSSNTRTIS